MFFENQKASNAQDGIGDMIKDQLDAYKDDLITIGKTDKNNNDVQITVPDVVPEVIFT